MLKNGQTYLKNLVRFLIYVRSFFNIMNERVKSRKITELYLIALAWKAKRFCICRFFPSSYLRFFRNIGEFGAKKSLYTPMNSQDNSVICCDKRKFFWSVLFLNKSQRRAHLQILLDKCSHLSICISLK